MRSIALVAAVGSLLAGCSSVIDALESPEPNIGPCPTAFALHDAHRYVDIDGEVVYENVGFTGEILAVRSLCSYYDDRPILANLEIDLGFGRGPAAMGSENTYEYFVVVTHRHRAVIEKETFPIRVRFRPGEDRLFMTERVDAISIPRATPTTSGTNFEILVGFELTDEQIAFNRSGRRFRVAAGQD